MPICSATFINKLLNISSMIGSTPVPIAHDLIIFFERLKIRSLLSLSVASQPGSIMIVDVGSIITAGPLIFLFGSISLR